MLIERTFRVNKLRDMTRAPLLRARLSPRPPGGREYMVDRISFVNTSCERVHDEKNSGIDRRDLAGRELARFLGGSTRRLRR